MGNIFDETMNRRLFIFALFFLFALSSCENLNKKPIAYIDFSSMWDLATLQMVNHICDVAFTLSDVELQELSWSDFVATVTEPELIQYLKERRLYINEEITTEEDM